MYNCQQFFSSAKWIYNEKKYLSCSGNRIATRVEVSDFLKKGA